MVDLVIVLLDARVPESSLNPEVVKKFQNKQVLYILTKADKADPTETKKWCKYYESTNTSVISVNSKDSQTKKLVMKKVAQTLEEKRKKDALKGLRPRAVKAMVVGIPNVGKSTLINNLSGKKVANVGDKPGVTKAQQWIKLNHDSKDMNLSKLWEIVKDREAWHSAVHGVTKSQTCLETEKQQQYPSMVFLG